MKAAAYALLLLGFLALVSSEDTNTSEATVQSAAVADGKLGGRAQPPGWLFQ